MGVPALFFVSTFHLETGTPFWFDKVVTPIQQLGLESLDLRDLGLGRYVFASPDRPETRWDQIQGFLVDLKALGDEGSPEVEGVIDHLESTYGRRVAGKLADYRPLTVDEVREMAADPLCHWGSHSHRHIILPRLPEERVTENLARSRDLLSGITGRSTDRLSWPNGDFDENTCRLAAELGYTTGFSTRPGLIDKDGSRMALPRLLIGGYDSCATIRFQVNRLLLRGVKPS
jgi:hypothetical protein